MKILPRNLTTCPGIGGLFVTDGARRSVRAATVRTAHRAPPKKSGSSPGPHVRAFSLGILRRCPVRCRCDANNRCIQTAPRHSSGSIAFMSSAIFMPFNTDSGMGFAQVRPLDPVRARGRSVRRAGGLPDHADTLPSACSPSRSSVMRAPYRGAAWHRQPGSRPGRQAISLRPVAFRMSCTRQPKRP